MYVVKNYLKGVPQNIHLLFQDIYESFRNMHHPTNEYLTTKTAQTSIKINGKLHLPQIWDGETS